MSQSDGNVIHLRMGSRCPTCRVGEFAPIDYGMHMRPLIGAERRRAAIRCRSVAGLEFRPKHGFTYGPDLNCFACNLKLYREHRLLRAVEAKDARASRSQKLLVRQ
jgi:hypothetical protein